MWERKKGRSQIEEIQGGTCDESLKGVEKVLKGLQSVVRVEEKRVERVGARKRSNKMKQRSQSTTSTSR